MRRPQPYNLRRFRPLGFRTRRRPTVLLCAGHIPIAKTPQTRPIGSYLRASPGKAATRSNHAGRYRQLGGRKARLAVSLGSQFGAITMAQVSDALRSSIGFDLVVFAGLAVDAEA